MSTLTGLRERAHGTHIRMHGSVLAEAEKRLDAERAAQEARAKGAAPAAHNEPSGDA